MEYTAIVRHGYIDENGNFSSFAVVVKKDELNEKLRKEAWENAEERIEKSREKARENAEQLAEKMEEKAGESEKKQEEKKEVKEDEAGKGNKLELDEDYRYDVESSIGIGCYMFQMIVEGMLEGLGELAVYAKEDVSESLTSS